MKDLGTLGGPDASAILINQRGDIAGISYTNSIPTTDPFFWQNGKMTDLGTLGGTTGFPLALNNRGQVVGFSNLAGDQTFHPFLWPGKDGKMLDLGTLGGNFGTANAINEAGEVTGYASNVGDQVFAFLWRNRVLTSLGTVDGDPCSTGNAINSKRQVVGISATCDFTVRHAFLWENGSMVALDTLIPAGAGVQLNLAETINDRGEIAVNGDPPGCGAVEQCGRAYLLIPCDDEHPDVEGCDYSMVAADTAASRINPAAEKPSSASPNQVPPAFDTFSNPMLRRFGPWYRGMGAVKPNSTATRSIPPSASKATLSEPLLEESRGNQILPPESCVPGPDAGADSTGVHVHGHCDVDWTTHRLNGGCVARAPWNPLLGCVGKYVPAQCPVGAKPNAQVLGQCFRNLVLLDAGRSCDFVWP